MDKWLRAASKATTPQSRRKFTRRHRALKLHNEIAGCENCPLHVTRTNAVPFDNPYPTSLAIVGEAPGQQEDETGIPFVGKSGQLLDKVIESLGYARSDVTVLNTVCCRPPKNRKPSKDEIAACKPLFTKQLDFTGAWVVVLLGASALEQIRPGLNITQSRGKPFWQNGRIFIPTFHPAYALRNRKIKPQIATDIGLAFRIVNGYEWWEPLRVEWLAKPNDSDSKYMTEMLDVQGWFVVDSKRLNDRIVVVKDDLVKVPVKYGQHIRYTVEELVRVGELSAGARLNVGWLDSVHLVKKMGGVVVS